MIYENLDNLTFPNELYYPFDAPSRAICSLMFVPNHEYLLPIISHYDFKKNDMENCAHFWKTNRDICSTFPIIHSHTDAPFLSENFSSFNKIFDAAAIGQYLGGVDPRNTPGDTRGFVNETCLVDYSKYKFVWMFDTILKLYKPYIMINSTYIPIVNLHIHSKRLHNFSSALPLECKLIPFYLETEYNIITGERLEETADIYCGRLEDLYYNPRIRLQTSKHLNLLEVNKPFNNPKYVFCYTDQAKLLYSKLNYFNNPFVLITHNNDGNIDESHRSLLESDKIIKWYAQNIMVNHAKLHLLPIGIANSMWPHGNIGELTAVMNAHVEKLDKCYFYFNVGTNSSARQLCKDELVKKGLVFGRQLNTNNYLIELASYKFAICPPGNGIDSHRIWECYYLGVIPVVIRNTFTELLGKYLPCIILDSWSAIDMSVILPQYPIMIDQLIRNKRFLDLDYYRANIIHSAQSP
jgi:hypothetical protein